MRGVIRVWLLPVAVLVLGGLLAGCGGTAKHVIDSLPTTAVADTVTPSPVIPTTAAPTTAPPTTAAPTTPAATTPAATTAAPTPSPTSTGSSSTSTPAWLWLILALVVIAGLAFILIARAASRRSAVSGRWRSAVTDVYARGSALHDAMASVEWPSAGQPQGQAQARWVDIQNRADDLAQTLYRLRETAPDEDSRARVDDVLAALQSVRTAMDTERARGGGTEQNEYSRSRLYTFARSLRALHGDPEGSGLY